MRIAFLAQGKLFLKEDPQPPRQIESDFGRDVVNRVAQLHNKHAWKTEGRGGQFMRGGMIWGRSPDDPTAVPVQIEAVTRGTQPGDITYTLETDRVGGIFEYLLQESRERRLVHKNEFRPRDLDRRPESHHLACSVLCPNGIGNIGVMEPDGNGLRNVTEGDSLDQAPSWVPGSGKRLVFQSAGIGRTPDGHMAGLGPYCVQELDLDRRSLAVLLEDPAWDFLLPHKTASGALLYIRRPYEMPGQARVSPGQFLMDIVLFPFRVCRAFVHFLNVFSMFFSGKPVATMLAAGGPRTEGLDMRRLMILGRWIDVQEAMKKAGTSNDASAGLVPKSWELVRREPNGAETVLATGVVAYDLAPDETVVLTNGRGVFALGPDGQQQPLFSHTLVEKLVALG